MRSKHSENKARREWWLLHIDAFRRSGLGIRKYCPQQALTENTLRRAGNETALKLEKYQTELRRERAREEQEKALLLGTHIPNAA